MASVGGRVFLAVKDKLRPSNFDRVCHQRTFPPIFRNDYCTSINSESRLTSEELDEEEISRICDASGLSETLKARAHGQLPPRFGERSYHHKKNYRRKLFNRFGRESGLNPGSMWPSKAEMRLMIEEQAEYEVSVGQMLAEVEKQKQLKDANDRLREKRISEQMEKMPQILEDYHKRCKQKDQLLKQQAEKKARLLAEAQEYFGFSVDPRDDKFKQMIAEKEAAEKKEEKQRKKAEKLAKMTAQLGN